MGLIQLLEMKIAYTIAATSMAATIVAANARKKMRYKFPLEGVATKT